MRLPLMLLPLRRRDFSLLWIGQVPSLIGDSAFRIVLILFIVDLTGSAGLLATVTAAFMIPNLIAILGAGIVVDRFARRSVLIGSDAVRGLCVAALAVVATADDPSIAVVVGLYAVFGIADAFFQPAYVAIVPQLVGQKELVRANSLTASARQGSLIAGPLVGAFLYTWLGATAAFALDAATFGISVATLLMIRASTRVDGGEEETEESPVRGLVRNTVEGARYVTQVSWLGVTILVAAFVSAGSAGATDVGLPFLVQDHVSPSGQHLGTVYTAQAVGALVAAVVLGQSKRVTRVGLVGYGLMIAMGVAIALSGAFPYLIPLLLLAGLYGFSYQGFGVLWTTAVQERVPDRLLGRVYAIDHLGSFVLMPAGLAVFGFGVDSFGSVSMFIVTGIVMGLAPLIGLLSPGVRRLRSDATPVHAEATNEEGGNGDDV